jgi:DNA mismatch repair protein MutL
VAVLFIRVPAERLDVNVHPTKNQVRFAGYRKVYETLKASVFSAWDEIDHPRRRPFTAEKGMPANAMKGEPAFSYDHSSKGRYEGKELPFQAPCHKAPFEILRPSAKNGTLAETLQGYRDSEKDPFIKTDKSEEDGFGGKPISPLITIIGQIHNTYIVCESKNGMIMIDQHAAHERILFEQMKKKSSESGTPVQKYLIPETLDLGYKESAILEKLIPGLSDFGLEVEPFGGCTFAVKSAPEILSGREIKPLILEILDKIGDIGFSEGIENVLDNCLILMACHGAIRAGQRLSEREMNALVDQLECCENKEYCPHGRPIKITWPLAAIEKKFKRIV